jgi:hypothetical protein
MLSERYQRSLWFLVGVSRVVIVSAARSWVLCVRMCLDWIVTRLHKALSKDNQPVNYTAEAQADQPLSSTTRR